MTIGDRFAEHLDEVSQLFPRRQIVGIFLQGSQNYGLDTEESDVDTKCLVLPSFKDVVFNKKPVSTTHIRENNEHIDLKDIRKMLDLFRKQNINCLEILFTQYFCVNTDYASEWNRLISYREAIARYCPYNAVSTMKGMSMEKYKSLEHPYPSKLEVLKKYGYDTKQLLHLLRFEEFLCRYINGESYEACLRPRDPEYLLGVKDGFYTLDEARREATAALNHIDEVADKFCHDNPPVSDAFVDELLNDVQYNIMWIALKEELLDD